MRGRHSQGVVLIPAGFRKQEKQGKTAAEVQRVDNKGISIAVHNSLASMENNPWRQRTEMLEYELAVKWFALTAHTDGQLAGFMHLIRHPERDFEWYCCDVNTMDPYRRQGIATAMYQEAETLFLRYGKACRITASVSSQNTPSVKLHEKLGFFDTHEPPAFPGLDFGPDETVFAGSRRCRSIYPS